MIKKFLNAYHCSISTKLRDFHYRVLTLGIVTNIDLKLWKIKSNDFCSFCNCERESVIHLLCDCLITRRFWDKIMLYFDSREQNLA